MLLLIYVNHLRRTKIKYVNLKLYIFGSFYAKADSLKTKIKLKSTKFHFDPHTFELKSNNELTKAQQQN